MFSSEVRSQASFPPEHMLGFSQALPSYFLNPSKSTFTSKPSDIPEKQGANQNLITMAKCACQFTFAKFLKISNSREIENVYIVA